MPFFLEKCAFGAQPEVGIKPARFVESEKLKRLLSGRERVTDLSAEQVGQNTTREYASGILLICGQVTGHRRLGSHTEAAIQVRIAVRHADGMCRLAKVAQKFVPVGISLGRIFFVARSMTAASAFGKSLR